jgi:hypothetical protein
MYAHHANAAQFFGFGFLFPPEDSVTLWEELPASKNNEISVWDGSIDKSFEGSGLPEDPFLIKSAAQLAGFAKIVNEGDIFKYSQIKNRNDEFAIANVAFVRLLTDIDLNNIEWEPIGNDPSGSLQPNGNKIIAFGGFFDGNGHVIKNLKIKETPRVAGFFGQTMGSHIANLSIENASLSGRVAGILAGSNWGIVDNCHVKGTIEVGKTGPIGAIGGLIGNNYQGTMLSREADSIIKNCSAHVTIITQETLFPEHDFIGGFVGLLKSSRFINCYSFSNISIEGKGCVGGFAGGSFFSQYLKPIFTSCNAGGVIKGDGVNGGFIGFSDYNTIASNCFSSVDISNGGITGGFAGINRGTIENSMSFGITQGTGVAGGFIGQNNQDADEFWNNLPYYIKGMISSKDLEKRMGKAFSCSWFQDGVSNKDLPDIGEDVGESKTKKSENTINTFGDFNSNIGPLNTLMSYISSRKNFRASKNIYAKPKEIRTFILDSGEEPFLITSVTPNQIGDTPIVFSGNKIEIIIGDNPINDADISIAYIDKANRKLTKVVGLSTTK